jgi:PAS domain S-box-containing protein
MRILIADDEPLVRRLIERSLQALNHEVVAVLSDGDQVLETVAVTSPDLVTLDLDMPGPDAFSIAEQLAHRHEVAVVVVSGRADVTAASELAQHGIGAVVRKPFTLQDLAIGIEVASARFADLQYLRRQTEEAERERVRMQRLFDASADGIYMARGDGTMAMINDAGQRLLGMTSDGTRGRCLDDWPGDFGPRTAEGERLSAEALPLQRALLRGEVVRNVEFWIDTLDGARRCLSMSAAPVTGPDGRIVEAVAVMRDVTREREREREAHRRAERRRRELTALSTELVAATTVGDLQSRCINRVREALGADRARIITSITEGKSWLVSADTARNSPSRGITRSLPPESLGLAGYALSRKETVRCDDVRSDPRYRLEARDGDERCVIAAPMTVGDRVLGALVCSSTVGASFDAEDAHLMTLMANQTAVALENLRLASNIADQQKLAALGLMAAGVVHEIKNPMVYIQANIESALELLDRIATEPDPVIDPARLEEDRSALSDARSGCARVFKIIDDIKTYAHPGHAQRELADVNKLVEVALTLSQRELRRWCKVVRDLGQLPMVPCDGAKISQVVLNLLVNAAQALEREARVGTIEVTTRYEDGRVFIVVADDGPGMDSKILEKVFLPFFTTKPSGLGTGLGLSISKRLMESQGGTIEVESAPGKGARFTIVLPVGEVVSQTA